MLREYYFPLSKHLLEKMQVTASYVCIFHPHLYTRRTYYYYNAYVLLTFSHMHCLAGWCSLICSLELFMFTSSSTLLLLFSGVMMVVVGLCITQNYWLFISFTDHFSLTCYLTAQDYRLCTKLITWKIFRYQIIKECMKWNDSFG